MGLVPAKTEDAPINGRLQQITDLDQDRITVIARTLNQAQNFNEIVREHVAAMSVGDRYRQITEGFNSIRDDAKGMVDQIADGKISAWERATNSWMKLTRGDVADRFDKIRKIYLDVTKETKNQIQREAAILEAYRDFRGALKQAEVMALEVLKKAEWKLDEAKKKLNEAAGAVA